MKEATQQSIDIVKTYPSRSNSRSKRETHLAVCGSSNLPPSLHLGLLGSSSLSSSKGSSKYLSCEVRMGPAWKEGLAECARESYS